MREVDGCGARTLRRRVHRTASGLLTKAGRPEHTPKQTATRTASHHVGSTGGGTVSDGGVNRGWDGVGRQ